MTDEAKALVELLNYGGKFADAIEAGEYRDNG